MRKTREYVDGRQVVEPTVWDVVINRDIGSPVLVRGRIVRVGDGMAAVIDDDGEEYETPMDNLYLDKLGWSWLLRSEDPPLEEVGW